MVLSWSEFNAFVLPWKMMQEVFKLARLKSKLKSVQFSFITDVNSSL